MRIRNLLILGLVLMGFSYCSSDEVLDGPTTGNENASNLKMEIAIKMPTAATTRSKTGDTTTEAGTPDENKVNSVTIALYSADEQTFVATHTSTLDDTGVNASSTYYTTAEFVLPEGALNKTYFVYAFVNPYTGINVESLQAAFAAKGTLAATIDAITKQGAVGSETQDNFFMSNAEKVQTITVNASHINGAPLKVAVDVQRAVARMDYVKNTSITDNKYEVTGSDVKVEFTHYKLINTSKSFYNLKHVNTSGVVPTDAAAFITAVGVAEDVDNYVVDADWADKITTWPTGVDPTNPWIGGFFNYMGTTAADNYKALDVNSYVTENTMPKIEVGGKLVAKKGMATAVVFKGKLVLTGTDYGVTEDNEDVYVWNNKFYGVKTKLPQAIQDIFKLKGAETDLSDSATITRINTDLANAGVTGYSYEEDYGYPVYYVYYNRHNDNGNPSETGPMEFATVRNNIYKLTINSLSKFGHPNDPEGPVVNPDPNPEKPEDDIESSTLYMQVTATVLDWTVRTNSIEF